jgi:hypothetical protein
MERQHKKLPLAGEVARSADRVEHRSSDSECSGDTLQSGRRQLPRKASVLPKLTLLIDILAVKDRPNTRQSFLFCVGAFFV